MDGRGIKGQRLAGGAARAATGASAEGREPGWPSGAGVLPAGQRVRSEGPRGALPGAGAGRRGRDFPQPWVCGRTGRTGQDSRTAWRLPSRWPLPVLVASPSPGVAGSTSRRLPAGCQASMIGPASAAFLPPPARRPRRSPRSLPPRHSSSAHTRFLPLSTPEHRPAGTRSRGGRAAAERCS